MTSQQYLQAANYARYRSALKTLSDCTLIDGDPGRPLYDQACRSLSDLIYQEHARLGLDTKYEDEK